MTNIIPFSFEGTAVRIIDRDGEPWFVGRDVAGVLGYADPNDALNKHCKALKKLKTGDLPELSNIKDLPPSGLIIIPERDVYRLIMRSKLPAAERFEEWVVGEVLPTIRKTGGYGAPTITEGRIPSRFRDAISAHGRGRRRKMLLTRSGARAVDCGIISPDHRFWSTHRWARLLI